MQDRYAGEHFFIGLDPADPYAKRLRPWDYAVLDGSLACTFGQWMHNEDGDGIIPASVGSRPFTLPLMAPKALRARQMQQCESVRVNFGPPVVLHTISQYWEGHTRGSLQDQLSSSTDLKSLEARFTSWG